MIIFNCERCGYETNLKKNFERHLSRVRVCKAIKSDITIYDVIDNYHDSQKSLSTNFHQFPPISTNFHQNPPISTEFKCEYCDLVFSRIDSLNRHIENRCKIKKQNAENDSIEKDKVEILKNELYEIKKREEEGKQREDMLLELIHEQKKEMMNQMELVLDRVGDNNSNNTTNSHNTQNITINSFGKEDTSHITPQYLTNLLKFGPSGAIPKLARDIHFNNKLPQNQNLKITNKKFPFISVYEDNRWMYKKKSEVLEDMVQNNFEILDEHFEDHGDEDLNQRQQDRYKDFRYKIENSDPIRKDQKDNIELLILNFSKK
jgi:hypothetical protein